MASGGGLPHPLLPPPVHSPLHPLHSPSHFPNMSSLHKNGSNSTNSPSYGGEYNLAFPNSIETSKLAGVTPDKLSQPDGWGAILPSDFVRMLEALFEMWPFLMKDSEYTVACIS